MKSKLIMLACVAMLTNACQNNKQSNTQLDTPTSGNITMSADETLQPLVSAELDVFHAEYPKAKIKTTFKPESDAILDLLNDSVRLAVTTRKLTKEEEKVFSAAKIRLREVLWAHDALAIIIHPENTDTLMTVAELKGILSGQFEQWKQLESKVSDKITVVVDNNASSATRMLQDSLLSPAGLAFKRVFAVNNNLEVINYVKTHKGAVGIIGVNWISDTDDSTANTFFSAVKVVQLQNEDDLEYYTPQQAYIALKKYPLTRKVYAILREPRAGLGTGFTNFLAGDKGQRIVLKSGLVPATMPVRLIKTKKDDNLF